MNILSRGALLLWLSVALAGCASRGGLEDHRSDVVQAALSQVGTPYVYGGTAPGRGLDCSGLMQHAHSVAGVAIPRTAADQHRASRVVHPRSLQPGDMVFFRIGAGNHVGLMVDSDRFVHASTSKRRVVISRFDTPYWRRHFTGSGTYLP